LIVLILALFTNGKAIDELKMSCFYISKHYGLSFVFFTPRDTIKDGEELKVYFFDGDKWQSKKIKAKKIDLVFDRVRNRKKYPKIYQKLSGAVFNHEAESPIDKAEQYKLFKDEDFSIPFIESENIEQINDFISKNGKSIIKPIYSYGTSGIIVAEKHIESIEPGKYVVQKFLDLRAKDGTVYDVRIHTAKTTSAKWETIREMVKIGGKDEDIIRTFHDGGGFSPLADFLNFHFENKKEKITEEIREKTRKICKIWNEAHPGIPELGIDFGIDKNGEVWLLEVNNRAPGIIYREFGLAEKTIKYLINKRGAM
jgi:hypothetical protein